MEPQISASTQISTVGIAFGITVDGEKARDLDDAFWVEEKQDSFLLTVAIAGVSELVAPGSRDDRLAATRMHNIYSEEANDPKQSMLPALISHEKASLLPMKERKAFVYQIIYSKEGKLISGTIEKKSFQSLKKIDYLEFEMIANEMSHPWNDMATAAVSLASRLWRTRIERAGMPHWRAAFDAAGNLTTTHSGILAQTVLHEFMVATNNFSASEMHKYPQYPIIYRNQGPGPGGSAGKYEVVNRGNYKLGYSVYGLFTCPIREYVHLINQRQMESWLNSSSAIYSKKELFQICAMANRVEENIKALSFSALRYLDIYSFRQYLQSKEGITQACLKEFKYRLNSGNLTFQDIAWCLFSPLSILSSEEKTAVFSQVYKSKETMPKIWEAAVNQGNLGLFEGQILFENDQWHSQLSYGTITANFYSSSPLLSRAGCLCLLAAKIIEVPIVQTNKILVLFDMFARSKLVRLCKVMGWKGPEYKQSQVLLGEREMWKTQVEVLCSGFIFYSPAVYTTTRKGGELISAENSLAQLESYARLLMEEEDDHLKFDLSWIDVYEIQNRPLTVLADICVRWSLVQDCIWIVESHSQKQFECWITLKGKGIDVRGRGAGNSRTASLEKAAEKILESFLQNL